MAQTFFIDSDEEIISVIGYLRKSPEAENYFVFPKRSLVLQSAVNLRLFQREAEKQGKRIAIISQDENGRQLAERVGIPTKEYSAEMNAFRPEAAVPAIAPVSEPTRRSTSGGPDQQSGLLPRNEKSPVMPSLGHLGSDTFASTPVSSGVSTVSPQSGEHRLRIRDASSQYQTSLNSVRANDVGSPAVSPLRNPLPQLPSRPEDQPPIQSDVSMHRQPAASIRNSDSTDLSGRNQRLERFFSARTRKYRSSTGFVSGREVSRSPTCPSDGSQPDSFDAEGPERILVFLEDHSLSFGWDSYRRGYRCGGVLLSSKSFGSDYAS